MNGKMLSVTKYSFQVCFRYSARAMTQAQLHNSRATGMADIPSAAFVLDEDLACELEISNTEGILLP